MTCVQNQAVLYQLQKQNQLKDNIDGSISEETHTLRFKEMLEILQAHNYKLRMPLSELAYKSSFTAAISECLFDSPKFALCVISKCLKQLKQTIKQKENGQNIPLRLSRLINSPEDLRSFKKYGKKNASNVRYTNILAELVSHAYNVKVCLYKLDSDGKLECSNFANSKTKIVNVFQFSSEDNFYSLKDLSEISEIEEEKRTNELELAIIRSTNKLVEDEQPIFFEDILSNASKKSAGFSGLETTDSSGNSDLSDQDDDLMNNRSAKAVRTYSNMSDIVIPSMPRTYSIANANSMSQFNPMPQMTQEFQAPVMPIAHKISVGQIIECDNVETHMRSAEKPNRLVINESDNRVTGTLKFYNENKGFGFISIDLDGSEIFLHCDDLLKANIDIRPLLRKYSYEQIKFNFRVLDYMGKYNKSRKVIDINLMGNY